MTANNKMMITLEGFGCVSVFPRKAGSFKSLDGSGKVIEYGDALTMQFIRLGYATAEKFNFAFSDFENLVKELNNFVEQNKDLSGKFNPLRE